MFKSIVESVIGLLDAVDNMEVFARESFVNAVKSLTAYSIKCVATHYLAREQVLVLKLLLRFSVIVSR